MRATVFIDVLSHWCLAAVPAVQSLYDNGIEVEVVIAPIGDGKPMGLPAEAEAWFYRRGTRAYAMELKPAWYEHETTTTWHANAAVAAGATLGADKWRLSCAVMSEAMQGGALFGRPEIVYGFVGELLGVDAAELQCIAETQQVADLLRDGNRRLAKAGGDERPTFKLENTSGDFALLKGLWQRDAVDACIRALHGDESAYAAAGTPPSFP